MPTILSINEIIELGRVSTYLSANHTSKQTLYGGNITQPVPPVQLAFVTDALDWGNAGGAESADSLRNVANYLYWLCGRFGLEAQRIISGAGGGSVVPTPAGATLPFPYDWIVGATTSSTEPLKDGDTSAILTAFIGYNIEFTRNNLTQNTTNPGDGSTWYSWNRVTGEFSVTQAVATGERLRITPV